MQQLRRFTRLVAATLNSDPAQQLCREEQSPAAPCAATAANPTGAAPRPAAATGPAATSDLGGIACPAPKMRAAVAGTAAPAATPPLAACVGGLVCGKVCAGAAAGCSWISSIWKVIS